MKLVEIPKDLQSKKYSFPNEYGSFTSVFVYFGSDKSKFIVQTIVRIKNTDGTHVIKKREKEFSIEKYESFIEDLNKKLK